MDSILERLLLQVLAPLLTAKTKPNTKSVKKATERQAKPARARKPTKSVARPRKPVARKTKSVARPVASRKTSANSKSIERAKKNATSKKPSPHEHAKVVAPPSTPPKPPPKVPPPPKPVPPFGRAILIAPENEKFADSVHPTFRWLSVGGATRYEVTWSETHDFVSSHSVISIATEATVPVEKPLRLSTTYFWRVRGGNEAGWGPWSTGASFRVLDETV